MTTYPNPSQHWIYGACGTNVNGFPVTVTVSNTQTRRSGAKTQHSASEKHQNVFLLKSRKCRLLWRPVAMKWCSSYEFSENVLSFVRSIALTKSVRSSQRFANSYRQCYSCKSFTGSLLVTSRLQEMSSSSFHARLNRLVLGKKRKGRRHLCRYIPPTDGAMSSKQIGVVFGVTFKIKS